MKWRAAAQTAIRPWIRGVAPKRPAPNSYAGEKPRVGVEGRDVHALDSRSRNERQERHERLVEVEHVELLALEHRRRPG